MIKYRGYTITASDETSCCSWWEWTITKGKGIWYDPTYTSTEEYCYEIAKREVDCLIDRNGRKRFGWSTRKCKRNYRGLKCKRY